MEMTPAEYLFSDTADVDVGFFSPTQIHVEPCSSPTITSSLLVLSDNYLNKWGRISRHLSVQSATEKLTTYWISFVLLVLYLCNTYIIILCRHSSVWNLLFQV